MQHKVKIKIPNKLRKLNKSIINFILRKIVKINILLKEQTKSHHSIIKMLKKPI